MMRTCKNYKNGRARKPSKKVEQRNEIIRILKSLRDVIDDSAISIKRSDLREMEKTIAAQNEKIEGFENRIEFIEGRDLGDVDKAVARMDAIEAELVSRGIFLSPGEPEGKIPPRKMKFWKRIFK